MAIVSCEDEGCLTTVDDFLSVAVDQIEWVADTAASYHAAYSREIHDVQKQWTLVW